MLTKPFVAALFVTSAMIAPAAIAQAAKEEAPPAADAAPPASDAALNAAEIVVTATRRAESLQKVPMSVNAVSGDQIEKLKLFDVKDVQQLVPGLELSNTVGRNNTTTLRGVTFDPDQGTSPAVQVYYNEIPTDAQTAYTAIYDIRQIEVLRGPQGLLRGLSAPAGSITIATERPRFDKPEGYLDTTVTSRAGYNVQGAATLPFSDALSLRVAGLVDGNRLNNVYNITRNQRSRSRTESARATLGWRPNGDFQAYLTYQYLNADNVQYQQVYGPGNTPYFLSLAPVIPSPQRSGPAIAPNDRQAVADGPNQIINNTHLLNLAWDWNLGPATLSFVGAHQYSLIQNHRDLDPGNSLPGAARNSYVKVPYKVDTAELRLTSNNDEGLAWGVGAFYTKQTGTTFVEQDANSYFAPLPVSFHYFLPIQTDVTVPVDTSTLSFNGSLSYRSGGLRIEGGLRYSIIKSEQVAHILVNSPGFAAFFIAPFSLTQDGVPANLQRTREKPLTGAVDISYDLTPTLTVYAAFGHAFRAGSAGVSVPVGVSADLIKTKPEKTNSYEAGVKGTLLDHRLSYAVSGFYQKINGYLSRFTGVFYNCPDFNGTCFTSPPAAPINNTKDSPNGSFDFNYNGNATIKGVEASLEGRVSEDWDVGVNMSYAHARYDHALLPCNDFAGTGIPNQTGAPKITGTGNVSFCPSNGRLSDAPDFSMSANSEIRVPMGSITPFLRGLFSYRPGFFSDRATYHYQDRELLNAYFGVRTADRKWEISLFAKNLLNQQRITNTSGGTAQTPTSAGLAYNSGYYLINTMNPREFGLNVHFRW